MTSPQPFTTLDLRPELLGAVASLGFSAMTPVQARALPLVLDGRDVIARGDTGSGKTAAFGLGLLQSLQPATFAVQALVLCPTRELAEQVADQLRKLARQLPNVKILSLCGGVPLGPQIGSLKHRAHVIVGTPGRVLQHLRKRTLVLSALKTLVLDEADRMLDMGFSDELDAILEYVPERRQTLLFSATYPPSIKRISKSVQHDPQMVDVQARADAPDIVQHWVPVTPADTQLVGIARERERLLALALQRFGGASNLVFCNTKIQCAEIAGALVTAGIAARELHGDLDQPQRSATLAEFANGSVSVLVATDVAARGLDISGLSAVFNAELPTAAEVYVHRIGRTGRAGESGIAVSLVTPKEMPRLAAVAELANDFELRQCELVQPAMANPALDPDLVTLEINGGRKQKLRPGDVVGALTADGKIPGDQIGKIALEAQRCFVAMPQRFVDRALTLLNKRRIKGRLFRARRLRRSLAHR